MSEMSGTLHSYLHIDIDIESNVAGLMDGQRQHDNTKKLYKAVHLVFMTAFMALHDGDSIMA